MSLVTRCTSCGTLFKVVADQLKISEGWVRCGQCAAVFDAQSNLVETPLPIAPAPVANEARTPAAFAAQAPTATPVKDADSLRDSAFDARDREALLEAFAAANVPTSLPAKDENRAKPSKPIGLTKEASNALAVPAPSHLDSQAFRPGKLRNSGELDSEAGPSTSSWTPSEYPARPESVAADTQEMASLHTLPGMDASAHSNTDAPPVSLELQAMPQFVQQAQRAARWRSPWMRFGLALVALVLLAALALQIVLQEKDQIAAQWPQTKPWLEQLCKEAGCKVEPLKRIESIAVDSSSFNRINKNNAQLEAVTQSYRLAVTLKNIGTLPVAAPHVELSLQDAQDQPIVRRVLSPADLGSSLSALAPTQDMAGSLTLQIDTTQLANRRIQGYRVLAFYP
ncbi:MAG: DUF3426 domain-containing protein [Burkholderiales bacterium]|nr:MAG: DUF3426 domain-containing protein [Burkholderiales bacterium]